MLSFCLSKHKVSFANSNSTTASAARTFSTLRRLKTWLRSSMNEDHLTGLALLAVATDMSVKLEAIADNFLKQGKRRIA